MSSFTIEPSIGRLQHYGCLIPKYKRQPSLCTDQDENELHKKREFSGKFNYIVQFLFDTCNEEKTKRIGIWLQLLYHAAFCKASCQDLSQNSTWTNAGNVEFVRTMTSWCWWIIMHTFTNQFRYFQVYTLYGDFLSADFWQKLWE